MHSSRQKILIVWILGALSTVTPLAIDLYLPSFADLAKDFAATQARISLSISSYFIGMALGQILYGPLLDRFGRKPPLYAGFFVFIAASLGCMLVSSVEALVALRFIQAIGGSVAWVAAVAMVRDFFPVAESARIFSLLVLILGVSPLLGPTIGGFISGVWGWRAVFVALAGLGIFIVAVVRFLLPTGYAANPAVSLRLRPIASTFWDILREPQFFTYALSGAFAFATLFVYVAASPVIFMEIYGLTPREYGYVFAFLSVGFIGSSQINIPLGRRVAAERIYVAALSVHLVTALVFLLCAYWGWLNLYTTIGLLFICFITLGFTNPNATALALAPFSGNMGSASALLGFAQIGISALSSAGVGLFNERAILPAAALIAVTAAVSYGILLVGRRHVRELAVGDDGVPVAH